MADKATPKIDPFKPAEPAIPGVPVRKVASSVAGPKLPPSWLSLGLATLLFLAAGFAWWRHTSRSPQVVSSAALAPPPASSVKPVKATKPLPLGPGEIATTEEVAEPWSFKRFLFHNTITDQTITGTLVHLPTGGYWAFSLTEPFGNCTLVYITDLKTLQEQYGIPAKHPMVIDPCNGSVFDLAKYGAAPSGLVRGEVVAGPGIRPPLAIQVKVQGNKIIAVRSE